MKVKRKKKKKKNPLQLLEVPLKPAVQKIHKEEKSAESFISQENVEVKHSRVSLSDKKINVCFNE